MKKGSLSLSIEAIVIIVVAFVVLGLGLTLTKLIFGGAESMLPEAFAVTKLEAQPTSSNPITISDTVDIDRGKLKTMKIGFYNRGENTAVGATFDMVECLEKGGVAVAEELKPSVASTSDDVGPSSALGYSIIVTENGLPAGTYICTIGVKCIADTCEGKDISGQTYYETKQFFLKVIA